MSRHWIRPRPNRNNQNNQSGPAQAPSNQPAAPTVGAGALGRAGAVGQNIGTVVGIGGAIAAGILSNIANSKKETVSAPNKTYVPPDIQGVPYYFEIAISNYGRSGLISIGSLTPFEYYYLPLPMQLVDGKSISFQDDKGLMPDAANAFKQSQVGVATSAFTGTTVNQLMVVVLDRPQFKNFELTWKFVPKNDKETQLLKKFILQLNKYTSPGINESTGFFKFPKIFQMAFRSSSGNNLWDMLYRFKPAIVEKMRVNFAAGGMPAFYNSSNGPESIELTLSFKELEYWVSEDYNDQEQNKFAGQKSTAENLATAVENQFNNFTNALDEFRNRFSSNTSNTNQNE
jgi:hypothetical protein